MANRTFDQYDLTILKRVAHLWAVVAMPSAITPTLQKWNYPTLGTGPFARTYTNAPTPAGVGASVGPFNHYSAGAEGVWSVAYAGATGLWNVQLQDNYQRILAVKVMQSTGTQTAAQCNIVAAAIVTAQTNMAASGGSLVQVALLSAAGVPANPSAGTIINLEFALQDATEP